MRRLFEWFIILWWLNLVVAVPVLAESLFQGRQIYLSDDDKHVFRVGVKGTTAGYNFFALVQDARQEAISLGDLGYWERVEDPPSFLRNTDLQLFIQNRSTGHFQIEFEYDKGDRNIIYRVLEGSIQIELDRSRYYPALLVTDTAVVKAPVAAAPEPTGKKRYVFFDFNSFDADLRMHYGKVKRILNHPDYVPWFYCYEAGNYNSYYFKTYENPGQLDTEKMGLSLEDGTLEYYQGVLDNLKSRHGADMGNHIILVTRYGKKFFKELKQYANEIGLSRDMVITFWDYYDIKTD